MNTYLLVHRHPENYTRTPSGAAAWETWFKQLGPRLVDPETRSSSGHRSAGAERRCRSAATHSSLPPTSPRPLNSPRAARSSRSEEVSKSVSSPRFPGGSTLPASSEPDPPQLTAHAGLAFRGPGRACADRPEPAARRASRNLRGGQLPRRPGLPGYWTGRLPARIAAAPGGASAAGSVPPGEQVED
jgi:hypothetical protein